MESNMNGNTNTDAVINKARRVGLDYLSECGARLREGDLVAFPTETVYGLGGNALNESACHKIFAAKERPLTDPLIVHVLQPEMAYPLWKATAGAAATAAPDEGESATLKTSSDSLTLLERSILQCLCEFFWPGPLTLVAQAATKVVPDIVMAGTGFVACRSPSHAVARALLEVSQVPIAAPSANKFGHVSPTTANHVWDDLQNEASVWILEDSAAKIVKTNGSRPHDEDQQQQPVVGVESSVVKLEMLPQQDGDGRNEERIKARLTILRQGAVSVQQIRASLQQTNSGVDSSLVEVVTKSKSTVSDQESSVSPGQLIRHYSPNVPSFLLSEECLPPPPPPSAQEQQSALKSSESDRAILKQSVLIDYGKRLLPWKELALDYRDLSPRNLSTEAAQNVYETLRWAERVPTAVRILFPNVSFDNNSNSNDDDALALAVMDRLTRAASGKVIDGLAELSV
ncbi:hypothetical protein ACA910_021414 [Epithemia clementina (nom. ined.)]